MNLSTGEVAKLLDVSTQTVINWVNQEKLVAGRIGNGPRKIKAESVKKFIEDSKIDRSVLNPDMLKLLDEKIVAPYLCPHCGEPIETHYEQES